MANRALLVGINAYPHAPLKGCVNDVQDMKALLESKYQFKDSDICLLADTSANRKDIVEKLNWLVKDATVGSRLLFHYSGHGTTMATGANTVEDAICPVDFDFTPEHALTASDFSKIFSSIPQGVEFNWFSDSCYSGNLTRALLPRGALAKSFPMTSQAQANIQQIIQKQAVRFFRFDTSSPLNGGFVSGCGPDETSADAVFEANGQSRYNGAFTYFLLNEATRQPDASLVNLAHSITSDLRAAMFSQTPQVKGSTSVTSQALLGGMTGKLVEIHAERVRRSFSWAGNGAARVEKTTGVATEKEISISGGQITISFKDVSVRDETDTEKLLDALAPILARGIVSARREGKKEWSVSGTVTTTQGGTTGSATGTYTSKDWGANVSVSTNVGGATFTGTVTGGAQGVSGGTVTISGTF